MHCHEAERRLTELESAGVPIQDDAELCEHIGSCRPCARKAEAANALARAFRSTANEDCADAPAWPWVQRRVEADAAAANRGLGRLKIAMTKHMNPFSDRLRWGIGMAAAVAVLALVTLVPFQYQETVGYEVAFAAGDKNVTVDQFKVQELLTRLGVENANIRLATGDAPCTLIISDLQSREHCERVVYAMKEVGDVCVIDAGSQVCEPASGSLVKLAKINLFSVSEGGADEAVESYVRACLGEDFAGQTRIFVSSCDSGAAAAACPPGAVALPPGCCDSAGAVRIVKIGEGAACSTGPGAQCVPVCGPNQMPTSMCDEILGKAGLDMSVLERELDAETLQQLKDLGFEVTTTPDGKRIMILKYVGEAEAAEGADDGAAKAAITPDGYALEPNFPNPFNPSTTIRFTIPRSGHVRVDVVNTLGQLVRTLVDEPLSAGTHRVQWDATNAQGERVPSGAYLYRIEAGDYTESRTMTLLK